MDTPATNRAVAVAVGVTAGAALVTRSVTAFGNFAERRRLARLRQRKQREREEHFLKLREKYRLGSHEEAITTLAFDQLVEKLQSRALKAQDVLEAYVAKALDITDEFNCITEFIPQCFEWAKELDKLPHIKGPLHGVPFCVKEDHNIVGMDTTLGCSKFLYQPASESAVIVRVLQEKGAVPFCKTNLPQTTLSGYSENPIFGLTLNPLNKKFNPGGSSSGTGCLVASGGAPFGLGSDIGGSIRIPASCCGISGLRPTIGRNSNKGMRGCFEGNAGAIAVTGIMAPTAEVVTRVQEVLWTDSVQNSLDPAVIPISWDTQKFASQRPLRIGYLTSIPITPAVGDVVETILKATKALKLHGHSLFPFEIPNAARIMQVYSTIIVADGITQLNNMLKNDAVSDTVKGLTAGHSLPKFLSILLFRTAVRFTDEKSQSLMPDPAAQDTKVLWDYTAEMRRLRGSLFQAWREAGLDVLLMPAFPTPGTLLENTDELMMSATLYLAIWNAMDFPAGVVPFGQESSTKVEQNKGSPDLYLQLASNTVAAAKGMPIAVQVVGLPYQEETVLRVMSLLEKLHSKN